MSPFTRLYYTAKPFLPRALRNGLRRAHARRVRRQSASVWPVLPGSERPPAGWQGWPDGKQFAVVLTHDVEGQSGYDQILRLAALEKEMGFRSSFNLIPEGPYSVAPELRAKLQSDGFEVGIHDLHHDGKLYRSHERFSRLARRINHYVQAWDVVGFRSAYMHHNLEWLGELDVAYDASTFDTDPFEPQPDGVGTIFPFWVPRSSKSSQLSAFSSPLSEPSSSSTHSAPRTPHAALDPVADHHLPSTICHLPTTSSAGSAPLSAFSSPLSEPSSSSSESFQLSAFSSPLLKEGFVELPYTLVQDSTLFLYLGDQNIDCWKQKIDWIARHGGMVMLNVHPDYLNFDNQPSDHQFSVSFYRELLTHLQDRFGGRFWSALPREVAAHVAPQRPRHTVRQPRRVCMLAHTYFENDGRVIRYAESLARRGDQVDVIALRPPADAAPSTPSDGISVFHVLDRPSRDGSQFAQLRQLLRFMMAAGRCLLAHQFGRRYDLIHVHNIPDFLVFATWLHKLCGGRVILDIHDVVPELYLNKFAPGSGGGAIEMLKLAERLSCSFSDHVIIANHLWFDKVVGRSVAADRCTPFINNVDTGLFRPRPRTRDQDRQIMIFPGTLQWHQGLDVAINAMHLLRDELPRLDLHIYGSGSALPDLQRQAMELNLRNRVRFFPGRPLREIVELVAQADLGVVPKRSDSFGNEAYSTKIMEFMALGIPAVVSRTKIDDFYFNDDVVAFFEPQNPTDLARAIKRVLGDQDYRERLVQNALKYVAANSWETVQQQYLDLVDRLLAA